MGLSFHCLSGWPSRSLKRRRCSLRLTLNQNLMTMHAAAHQLALELGRLAHEFGVFGVAAKAHDALDAGAVVPGAVEQHDLAARGQVLHVALEIPLAALVFGRLFQRHDACAARIQVLHEALDGAALAGRVAPLEQNHHALAGFLDPGLQLEQLDLQAEFFLFIDAAPQQVLIRVSAVAPACSQLLVGTLGAADRVRLPARQRRRQGAPVIGRSAFEQRAQGLRALAGLHHGVAVEQRQRGLHLLGLGGQGGLGGDKLLQRTRLGRGSAVAACRQAHLARIGGPCRLTAAHWLDASLRLWGGCVSSGMGGGFCGHGAKVFWRG